MSFLQKVLKARTLQEVASFLDSLPHEEQVSFFVDNEREFSYDRSSTRQSFGDHAKNVAALLSYIFSKHKLLCDIQKREAYLLQERIGMRVSEILPEIYSIGDGAPISAINAIVAGLDTFSYHLRALSFNLLYALSNEDGSCPVASQNRRAVFCGVLKLCMSQHADLVQSILYRNTEDLAETFLIATREFRIPFLVPLATRFPAILSFYIMEKVISTQPQPTDVAHSLLDAWLLTHSIQDSEQQFFDIVSANARYLAQYGLTLYLQDTSEDSSESRTIETRAQNYLFEIFQKRGRILYKSDLTPQKNEISLVLDEYPSALNPKLLF